MASATWKAKSARTDPGKSYRKLEVELLQTTLRDRLLLDHLPVIYWHVDRDLRITDSAGAGLANLGLVPGQTNGQTLYKYLQTTDSNFVPLRMHLCALRGERVCYSDNHQGRSYDCVLEPLRDDSGEIIGVTGLAHDVTERCQVEEQQRQLKNQIQQTQKLESLGILAGGIAHDFNNILVGILGGADLLLRELPKESPQWPLVEMIKKAGERAALLTRQMLVYAGKSRAERELVDLDRVIAENLPLLLAGLSNKRVHIVTQLAGNLPSVLADAAQIQQVVMNLILNAAEAGKDGNGIITITTGVQELGPGCKDDSHLLGGRYVFLEVADQGCGMAPDVQERIFDPFFTTKTTGRGLGLSAVKGIVEGHHGSIHLRSAMGQGTTFQVLLPADAALMPAAPSATDLPDLGRSLILVIDDDPFARGIAARTLARAGLPVLVADSGREGLEIFRAHQDEVALALLDMLMPDLNGQETRAALRQIRPDLKVVLTSGYEDCPAPLDEGRAGFDGFLRKPYAVHTLLETVGRVLQSKSSGS